MAVCHRFCLDEIKGKCLTEWRNKGCPISCPMNTIYKECTQCGDDSSCTPIGDDGVCNTCRALMDGDL